MDLIKVLLFIKIFFNIVFIVNSAEKSEISDVLTLTSNFFSNLNTFKKNEDEFLSEKSQKIIENQIEHYVELVRRTHGISKQKTKRNVLHEIDILSTDRTGVYILNGFFVQIRIPVQFPKDIVLFKHDFGSEEIWYAATLQSKDKYMQDADLLTIYRHEDEQYTELINISVLNAKKIKVYTIDDATYLVILEDQGTNIFLFDFNEKLHHIQTINTLFASDVAIWENDDDLFLLVTHKMINDTNGVSYELQNPVYKLINKKFIIFDYIDSFEARHAVPFKIKDEQYLIVANHKNNKGETNIFSEIYKFNKDKKIFELYQKILTHAVVDIQYFCFKQNDRQESFLIVANSYELDYEGNIIYESNSIVYKFVENYFMPFQSFNLNNVDQWLPVVGTSGEFILLASCKALGLKSFQYDGWRFIESETQYTGEAFGYGVVSIHSYIYKEYPVIVVANENDYGRMKNVFSPSFSYQKIMHEFKKSMNDWCQQILTTSDNDELIELQKLVDEAPKIDDSDIDFSNQISFHNVIIDNLVLEEENIADEYAPNSDEDFVNLQKQIDKRSEQLLQLNNELKPDNNKPVILKGNVNIKNLDIINDDKIVFEDLHTKSINKVQLDEFFNDIIFLDDSLSISDNLEFEDLIFSGPINPKFVNNIHRNNLLYTSTNTTIENDLIIDGDVTIEDLKVDELLDGIKINNKFVILTEGEQQLEGIISFSHIETDNINVRYINNIDLMNLEQKRTVNVAEYQIKTLKAKNISIGLVNGVDIHELNHLVLRTRGDQEIKSNYTFDTLIVDDFEVDGPLSNVNISDFVRTIDGPYLVEQDLIFVGDLEADHVHVIERLNQIPVENGKIDILLRDRNDQQHISGTKMFENVNLIGPIELRGHIKMQGHDRMSPFIRKNLTLTGNYTINGDVIIEQLFNFGDITDSTGTYSLSRLQEFGLRLNDSDIPVHLNLIQELDVNNIQVDSINGINTNSWIISENKTQIITGRKIFEGDLQIDGEAQISSINGRKLEDLHKNILRINGTQTITGNHNYENIKAIRVFGEETYLNENLWKDVLTLSLNKDEEDHREKIVNGTTILKKLTKVASFTAKSLEVKGKILDYNFQEIIEDTVFNNTKNIVTGKKHFKNKITFENLNAKFINNMNMTQIMLDIDQWLGDIHIDWPLEITEEISVNKIFCDEFNGIKGDEFGKVWLLKEGNQSIHGDQHLENVHSRKHIETQSKLVDDINLEELIEMAVRVDEEHAFDKAEFTHNVESQSSITLGGKLKNIDLSDAVLSNGMKNQTIWGSKTIYNNFTVSGHLHVNGLLSGINLSTLNQFLSPVITEKQFNLIINGNAKFVHETNVHFLNNFNLKEIAQQAWFTDRPTDFQGFISFENVIFEDDVTVDGYVDDIPLIWLSKNYFSKTKNQTIFAKLDFTDGTLFVKDLIAAKAIVAGNVSDINIEDFDARVMKNDDQTFKFDMHFDDVEIIEKLNARKINNLNLETDVMRKDVELNKVTGKKTIQNLNTSSLEISKNKTIQNVNVEYWLTNSISLDNSYLIDGLKILKNAKFDQDINLQGRLNDVVFTEENILLKNAKQYINGKKNFITPQIFFENLKIKGTLNNVNLDLLLNNKIDKSLQMIPISSPKNFHNTISASNINFEQNYHEINIPRLINNITDLDKVRNFNEEYEKLLNFSKKILSSLQHQAYFLHAYKVVQVINERIDITIPMKYNNKFSLALVKMINKALIISFYNWKNDKDKFVHFKDVEHKLDKNTFLSYIHFKNGWFLYIPTEKGNTLLGISPDGFTKDSYHIDFNATSFITSFPHLILNQNCILNVNVQHYANIMCETKKKDLKVHQQLPISQGIKASSLFIKNIPYLFILDKGSEMIDASLQIWKYQESTTIYTLHQEIFVTKPTSIDSIHYKGNYYIAIGLTHVTNIPNSGLIIIQKYDQNEDDFKDWQRIEIINPIDLKFSVLSTEELVLNIITDCPSEPLLVYIYSGISGFTRKITATTIPQVDRMNQFVLQDENYVIVSNRQQTIIIKAMYKGKKYV